MGKIEGPPVIIHVSEDEFPPRFFCKKWFIAVVSGAGMATMALLFLLLLMLGVIVLASDPSQKEAAGYDLRKISESKAIVLVALFFGMVALAIGAVLEYISFYGAYKENLTCTRVNLYMSIFGEVCVILMIFVDPSKIFSAITGGLWIWMVYAFIKDLEFLEQRKRSSAPPAYTV